MNHTAGAISVSEPLLDLDAMSAIVRELVAGGTARRQDEQWLRTRAESAGLSRHASDALETLRRKLCRSSELPSGGGG